MRPQFAGIAGGGEASQGGGAPPVLFHATASSNRRAARGRPYGSMRLLSIIAQRWRPRRHKAGFLPESGIEATRKRHFPVGAALRRPSLSPQRQIPAGGRPMAAPTEECEYLWSFCSLRPYVWQITSRRTVFGSPCQGARALGKQPGGLFSARAGRQALGRCRRRRLRGSPRWQDSQRTLLPIPALASFGKHAEWYLSFRLARASPCRSTSLIRGRQGLACGTNPHKVRQAAKLFCCSKTTLRRRGRGPPAGRVLPLRR